jgi:hypothetical protein
MVMVMAAAMWESLIGGSRFVFFVGEFSRVS